MGSSAEPAVPAYCRLRMLRKRPQVLGVDLNGSGSRSSDGIWRRTGEPPDNVEDAAAEPGLGGASLVSEQRPAQFLQCAFT